MGFFRHYFKPASSQPTNIPITQEAPRPSTAETVHDGAPARTVMPWQYSASDRQSSSYPLGDLRNAAADDLLDIKCDVMANWLHQQQIEAMWSANGPGEGIVLKRSRSAFIACPAELADEQDGFYEAIKKLNVRSAMTVNTRVIKMLLSSTTESYIPLADGLRLQILPDMSALATCQKHQFAAFIEDSSLLVVWDDDPRLLLARAHGLEGQILSMIWEVDEKYADADAESDANGKDLKSNHVSVVDLGSSEGEFSQSEDPLQLGRPRRVVLQQTIMTSFTLILMIAAIGTGWRKIAQEIATDHNMIRIVFVLVVPLQCWLAFFFFQSLIGSLSQLLGPISQINSNSKFYSAIRPLRIQQKHLPHVTVQCPVYKEGLKAVIEPTIRSVKTAISTYEMQGGTANIFVNDDGMQLASESEAQARRDFYDEHNIGWVARPKHCPKPENGEQGFVRAGKFKKASNMNYAMAVSNRVEEKLAAVQRPFGWDKDDELAAYNDCLYQVMEEDQGRTWADGNIRIGDYILIIDSDTRVPADCFLDAVSELEQSPQVAILQFSSGVMNVTDSFFERGITFFTNLIYTAIQYAVACGDVAPFVGHNAMLRWSAIQDVAYEVNRGEGYGSDAKYWSEDTVSEDFDMALRLQASGYLCRFAAYTGEGFKEGVSLTVYDELARWEKYAYGCNELVFQPFKYWITRGPFTPLFRRFVTSCMPLPSKFTIMAYIGTYYAIGAAWLLTLFNYFAMGWYNGYLDHYYFDSFSMFFSIIVVFTALGNLALAIYRYRLGTRTLVGAFYENTKWMLVLAVFLGGISMHVSQALLSHFFSIDMQWGATSKEAEDVTFFEEIPRVIKKFKWTFAICICCATGMGILAQAPFVPIFWRISTFVAIFPLSSQLVFHFLLPIVLNPNLMLFTW